MSTFKPFDGGKSLMCVSCTGDETRRGDTAASVPVGPGFLIGGWPLLGSGHSETVGGDRDCGKRERERGGGVMDLWRDARGVENLFARVSASSSVGGAESFVRLDGRSICGSWTSAGALDTCGYVK